VVGTVEVTEAVAAIAALAHLREPRSSAPDADSRRLFPSNLAAIVRFSAEAAFSRSLDLAIQEDRAAMAAAEVDTKKYVQGWAVIASHP